MILARECQLWGCLLWNNSPADYNLDTNTVRSKLRKYPHVSTSAELFSTCPVTLSNLVAQDF